MKKIKRILHILLFSFLLFGFTGWQPQASAITLKAIMAWPTADHSNFMFLKWVEMVNTRGKGEISIDVIGGPEAMPTPEQVGATQKGLIDIVNTAGGYYTGVIPEVRAFLLSELTPWQERESGFYDFINKIHKEHGLFYLGRTVAGASLGYIFTNVNVSSIKDFKGLKLRDWVVYSPLIKGLEAVPVNIPTPEIYTGMERGVIDGYITPPSGPFESHSLVEVTKYMIDAPFYQIPTVALINLNRWNKLSPSVQKLLIDTMIENERAVYDYFIDYEKKVINTAQTKGMKVIELPSQDTKKIHDLAYDAGWQALLDGAPNTGPKIRELLSK